MFDALVHAPQTFRAFGPSHRAVLVLFAMATVCLIGYGWLRRSRGQTGNDALGLAFALLLLAIEIPLQVFSMLPAQWKLDESLPFHLCDLAWMVAVVALLTRAAWAFGLLYYWGLTLTVQGLLTPHLVEDFPHWQFLLFFSGHSLVVLAAVYLTAVAGMRPTWRLLGTTIAVTVCWALLMLAFNALAGTNYLYVNGKPPTASAFDLMGPWPWYLGVALAIGVALWAAITWPWCWHAAHCRRSVISEPPLAAVM